jgi:hypothetical protein
VFVVAPWQALVVAPWQALVVAPWQALVAAALVAAALVGPADVMQTCSWNSFFLVGCDFNMLTKKNEKKWRLNGVQAHAVQQPVGKVVNALHDEDGPKHGVGNGVQFAARRDDLVQGRTHVQNERNGGHHHDEEKQGAILAVGEGGKPAAHDVGVVYLHNCCVHD